MIVWLFRSDVKICVGFRDVDCDVDVVNGLNCVNDDVKIDLSDVIVRNVDFDV